MSDFLQAAIASNLESLHFAGPELALTISILVIVAVDLIYSGEKRRLVMTALTLAGLAWALWSIVDLYGTEPRSLFAGMMALDNFGLFFKMVMVVTTIVVVLFGVQSKDIDEKLAEFYAVLLTIVLGGCLMASSTNLLMMYLSLELVSLPSFILAGYQRHLQRSNEAALKYVVYGGVSSGVMLYGFSLIYGLTGTLDIFEVSSRIAAQGGLDLTLFLAATLSMAGFGYKVASVPFHFWCPDVYEGAPTPVTAFLSVAPKAVGFAMLARFFYIGLSSYDGRLGTPLAGQWPELLAIVSACTMTLGNLTAIWQSNLKRLLAYSSIAHAGYMMMGVVMLSSAGLQGVMFYAAVYLFMNLGAFFVVLLVADKTGSEDIKEFTGLGWRSPFLAAAMTFFLASLTGLPPTAGFAGKVYLFSAVVQGGLWWLAVVGVLNSAVSLYYYWRIVRTMYLEDPATTEPLGVPAFATATLAVLFAGTVVFGIYFGPLSDLTAQSTTLYAPAQEVVQAVLR